MGIGRGGNLERRRRWRGRRRGWRGWRKRLNGRNLWSDGGARQERDDDMNPFLSDLWKMLMAREREREEGPKERREWLFLDFSDLFSFYYSTRGWRLPNKHGTNLLLSLSPLTFNFLRTITRWVKQITRILSSTRVDWILYQRVVKTWLFYKLKGRRRRQAQGPTSSLLLLTFFFLRTCSLSPLLVFWITKHYYTHTFLYFL